MAKPVGTVMYKAYEHELLPPMFDVAVHTNKGWFITDQDSTYPSREPAGPGWTEIQLLSKVSED
ncbi:hypothetical protein J4T99_gp059 [Mycobacterium phage Bromden]|uniref:Uncharacterized protein n=1 Tax=Mycobacterium phage Bromden TaxID=2283252 RepID=A0A345MBJ4_9CAUD|nr:hypothetical protein J4T99_gp059 [Mycobacterium phage Bromden]AXH67865.1 hypothetical protein SEA_BROMDEN_59 [Mycobacterium phage Bromden]